MHVCDLTWVPTHGLGNDALELFHAANESVEDLAKIGQKSSV